MKLLLTRAERLRYLGFDDLWATLLGVPILALVALVLFTANEATLTPTKVAICLGIGLMHTSVYWYLSRLLVVVLRRRLPLQEQTVRRILHMIAAALLMVTVVELISKTLTIRLFPIITEASSNAPLAFEFVVAFTLIMLVMGVYESVYFFAKYRHSLVEQERLARANMQSHLAALKQQINPHFLFNSLNTLTNLIPEDADKAVIFTQRLSAVYRRILEYRHHELIPLEEELTALRDYIFLMQTRFEDKLIVTWQHGGEGAGTQVQRNGKRTMPQLSVVPLTLQLLVENAIKHNVISEATPLHITIAIGEYEISVTNSLQLRRRSPHSTGWGQDNIRQRYRMVTNRSVTVEQTANTYRVAVPLLVTKMPPAYATA